MAWRHVDQPSEIVSVGEEVEVKVVELDRENEKISLSLQQMTSDPWKNIENKYPSGSKVSGDDNTVDYGPFFQLVKGIVGLIHVSEVPLVLKRYVAIGLSQKDDKPEVITLEIRKDLQRISLSK